MSSSVPVATIQPKLEAFARSVARVYANKAWPEAEVYSVMADALRVANSGAREYTDSSCVELHQEELEAEGRRKLIQLFQGRSASEGKKAQLPVLELISTRGELFKMIATCVKNHYRGLVHKHRFTAKRTGQKVPPKNSPELAEWRRKFQKPEVSLDASPEIRSHLEFQASSLGDSPAQMSSEEEDDLSEMCTMFEWACYQQCTRPGEAAMFLAWLDAKRGHVAGTRLDVVVRDEHRATALGIDVVEYTAAIKSVFTKLLAYRAGYSRTEIPKVKVASESSRQFLTEIERMVYQQLVSPNAMSLAAARAARCASPGIEHLAAGLGLLPETFSRLVLSVKTKLMDASPAAINALEVIFDVQVPRSVSALVVRRLFTLAARANFDKVTPQVTELLAQVGAEPPQVNAHDNLTCFGILYNRNHPVCAQCQARTACQTKATNVGLDQVTLRPDALPSPSRTLVRVPTVIVQKDERVSPMSEREESIRTHLEHHYRREQHGQTFYSHKEGDNSRQIVEIGPKPGLDLPVGLDPAFLIRLCNPSTELRAKLTRVGRGSYVPDTLSSEEVCKIIDQHADYLYSLPFALPEIPDLLVAKGELRVEHPIWESVRHAASHVWTMLSARAVK